MLNTIKNFKWFFAISILAVLLGVFTFITFINQNFIFLNENNLQYLLILDVIILVIFIFFLVKESSKLFLQFKNKKTGSKTSLNYVLQFSLFAFIPSLVVAIFSLIMFNVALQKYFDNKVTSAVNNSYQVAQNYIEETKKTVEADAFLVGIDLNRYSGILFSNPTRVQKSIRTQKLLRRLDEVYLIDGSGTILLGETNNPDDDFNGNFSVFTTVTENDGDNYSASTSFDVNILPVNDAPIVVELPIQSGYEDTNLSIDLSATDIDGDSDLEIASVGSSELILIDVKEQGGDGDFWKMDRGGPYRQGLISEYKLNISSNENLPMDFFISENYPNPFNSLTSFDISLNVNSFLNIKVYNIMGEEISTIYYGNINKGSHNFRWNGKNTYNEDVPSGLYFLHVSSDAFSKTKKMTLLK